MSKKKGARSKLLGVGADKDTEFGEWYINLVTRAELLDYYDISGCYILRPDSYEIWENIQRWFDAQIKALGVRNAYFPLLVSERALNTEKDHIADFCPEVAWVTRSGQSEMAEPVAIRPTSETIMYPAYAKWIRSYRDLPLRLNQWSNIVRWEFKDAVPFIRSREFLWQEGHSAFASKADAETEVLQILDLYRRVYEELLAVPVIPGRKSEKEKFAGGDYTTTVEAFVSANGRGIQAATSHHLGQNFSKMFTIEYEDEKGEKQMVYQNSWGLTTRSIGTMIMVHGDNSGLVMPPRVAPIQVVVVPIQMKVASEEVEAKAAAITEELCAGGIRAHLDNRKGYKPGNKFAHWEMRGIPVRLELGPKDLEQSQVVAGRRDDTRREAKRALPLEGLCASVSALLDEVQANMLAKARAQMEAQTKTVLKWEDFVPALNQKNICRVPWCCALQCENDIKKKSGEESQNLESASGLTGAAKSLCIPLEQPPLGDDAKQCFHCGVEATHWAVFGRSY
eukprot:TRINITY_DN142_c0_g1_i4.p1 TRINITY_DN142_c0_g1~~TRINITY_DN142_c0_g1_i4.p1  ORF type:complete len:561 (+),score=176.15 TRINITY_DN142_c0_g1_i4:159-1685(+)